MQFDNDEMFKVKGFEIKDTSTKKNECFFIIIAIRHNEIRLWSLTVLIVTYNHFSTVSGAHLIHQNLPMTKKSKKSHHFANSIWSK